MYYQGYSRDVDTRVYYLKYTHSRPQDFMLVRSVNRYYILNDFENESPRVNPLFHKPFECQ